MKRPRLIIAAIATTVALLSPDVAVRADDMSKMNMGNSGGSPADKDFMASMQKMMKDMDVKPTGNADKDFVRMMMPHHAGAVDMARIELKYGKDPMLLNLAADIVAAQEKEIAEMKDWLAKHGN